MQPASLAPATKKGPTVCTVGPLLSQDPASAFSPREPQGPRPVLLIQTLALSRPQNLWRIPTTATSWELLPEFTPKSPIDASAFTVAPLEFKVLPLAFW